MAHPQKLPIQKVLVTGIALLGIGDLAIKSGGVQRNYSTGWTKPRFTSAQLLRCPASGLSENLSLLTRTTSRESNWQLVPPDVTWSGVAGVRIHILVQSAPHWQPAADSLSCKYRFNCVLCHQHRNDRGYGGHWEPKSQLLFCLVLVHVHRSHLATISAASAAQRCYARADGADS